MLGAVIILASGRSNCLIIASPDIQGSRKRLLSDWSEEGSSDSSIQHSWLVMDEHIEGHDGGQAVVCETRSALQEVV